MIGPAQAFGMEVIAWSQNLTAARAAEVGAAASTRKSCSQRSDVVSIHLVLSERSRGLIGADELSQMTPDGGADQHQSGADRRRARRWSTRSSDGTIAGAGLDVYDTEPLPAGHALTSLDNVVLLPHLGYVSEASLRNMYEQVVEDIAGWRDGAPIRTLRGQSRATQSRPLTERRARPPAPRPRAGRTGIPACRRSSLRTFASLTPGRVRAVRHHRVVGVTGEHDPCRQRDLLADESVGVAAAVEPLVG